MDPPKTLLEFVHQQSFKIELAVGFTQPVSQPPATDEVELRNVAEVEDPEIKKIVCYPRTLPGVRQSVDLSQRTGHTLGHHGMGQLNPGIIAILDGYDHEQLSALVVVLTANPPAVVHLSRRSHDTFLHSHVIISHLAVLCFYLRGDGRDEVTLRRFAKFVCLYPREVIPHLLHFAPGIFTPRHIGWILRRLMVDCLEPGPAAPAPPRPPPAPRAYPAHILALVANTVSLAREAPHPAHRERIRQRQTLSELGCQLIASFLETRVSHDTYQWRLQMTGPEEAINTQIIQRILDIPVVDVVQPIVDAHETDWPVAKSIVAKSDVLVMMSIIFAKDRLRQIPEPFGWFLGVLFGGAASFAQILKERKEKHQRHVSAVLSLGFAAASFIPVAGQFAGLVGLLTDLAVHHYWEKEAVDARPYITRMEGLARECLSTSLRDSEARVAIVDAMDSTQKMGVKL